MKSNKNTENTENIEVEENLDTDGVSEDLSENTHKRKGSKFGELLFGAESEEEDEEEEEDDDIYSEVEGIIENPQSDSDKAFNTYLRVKYEYEKQLIKRKKCRKVGTLFILCTGLGFLALMFGLDSKIIFLVLWIISILSAVAVMVRIDYRCYKFSKLLGIEDVIDEEEEELTYTTDEAVESSQ